MKTNCSSNLCEMTQNELYEVQGGDDFLGFIGDIYDSWNEMWYDVGVNLYHLLNEQDSHGVAYI